MLLFLCISEYKFVAEKKFRKCEERERGKNEGRESESLRLPGT